MPEVTLRISGRDYTVTCDPGEEEHVRTLGRYVDNKAQQLVQGLGNLSEPRLLLLVSLMLANEVGEARGTLEALRGEDAERARQSDAVADTLESLAGRVETIVQQLEES